MEFPYRVAAPGQHQTRRDRRRAIGSGSRRLEVVVDHLHSEREYCELPTLVERAQIAALFLHRLAGGEFVLPDR